MPTTRLNIPYASLGSSADIEDAVNDAFDRIDAVAAADDQGPIASLPTPTVSLKGAYYWATDVKILLRCSGSAWRAIVEFPIGGVLDWPAATPPPAPEGSGIQWLEQNGSAIQKNAYPELFAAWGVVADVMVLPDRRGRVPVGAGTGSGLTARTVGQIFGVEAHSLTPAETAVRNHHHHMDTHNLGGGAIRLNGGPGKYVAVGGTSGENPGIGAGIAFNQFGSFLLGYGVGDVVQELPGYAHPNSQPSIVTRYFVRAR